MNNERLDVYFWYAEFEFELVNRQRLWSAWVFDLPPFDPASFIPQIILKEMWPELIRCSLVDLVIVLHYLWSLRRVMFWDAFVKRSLFVVGVTWTSRADKFINVHGCGSKWEFILKISVNSRQAWAGYTSLVD